MNGKLDHAAEPEAAEGQEQAGEGRKLTKNEKRRLRQKQQKRAPTNGDATASATEAASSDSDAVSSSQANARVPALGASSAGAPAVPGSGGGITEPKLEVEYVSADVLEGAELDSLNMAEFKKIFEHFAGAEELTAPADGGAAAADAADAGADGAAVEGGGDEADAEGDADDKKLLSKKQRRLRSRLTVAELKQLVPRPDVVEAHDVTAADPRMLVFLKSCRNTVTVPRHWCNKRKYLQNKRGVDKKPFELPEYIAATGISKVRQAQDEADAAKKARQKQREKVQPKMGKIDIDYQVLHDAFFKWQTKPKLTQLGDLYYEGKELEVRGGEKKPGRLSDELKTALGMHETAPPPWLVNMQRYGPPPSYPALRIPGLNAPIPSNASFGYHVGGWGKPPVDETGSPLYGDVFGTSAGAVPSAEQDEASRQHWGDMVESDEEPEEEEEPEEDEGADMDTGAGDETPLLASGATSNATTVGPDTPDVMLDLRKQRGLETPDTPAPPAAKELFRVLEQRDTSVGAGLFGADKRYVVSGGAAAGAGTGAKAGGAPGGGVAAAEPDIAVALNPDELEDELGDTEVLRERYEASVAAAAPEREDVSDIVAEETRKRKRKLDKAKEMAKDGKKKLKDFQF